MNEEAERASARDRALRVMIVEDNDDVASAMKEVLVHFGHDVVVAHHPHEALSRARVQTFDFFLLDIGLPDMDGYKLVQELKAELYGKPVTFAAHTGYGSPTDKTRAVVAGFHYHFAKPADWPSLMAALDDAPRVS